MPEAKVNGIRLYYEEQGDGLPIACIHGMGSSAMMWSGAVGELARRGRVITYDRRGCTRSERPEGRSYGGEVAVELALRHPERVRAMVLLEGVPMALSAAAARWEEDTGARLRAAAAEALPQARIALVDGSHLIDPAHPEVLGFIDAVLA